MSWLDRYQSFLYLLSLSLGAALSLVLGVEGTAWCELLVPAVLGVLLWANFMGIPFFSVDSSARASRSLSAEVARILPVILTVNCVLNPLIVSVLLVLFLPGAGVESYAVAIILLAPCIDYVVVFTRLAGGSWQPLLALTPLLLSVQAIYIPILTCIYSYIGILPIIHIEGFGGWTEGYGIVILVLLLPFGAAIALQYLLRHAPRTPSAALRTASYIARILSTSAERFMVPLMCLLLLVMAAAYTAPVVHSREIEHLGPIAAVYILYGALSAAAAYTLARMSARLDRSDSIAVSMSAATRNALVIFPVVSVLAVSLRHYPGAQLMRLSVVLQTLCEIIILLALVVIFHCTSPRGSGRQKNQEQKLTGKQKLTDRNLR
ncbi:MAG: hypothetical protein Q4P78_04365 [Rothia sp. (in: high G+C Gram-positive bacteria)]|uniref:hypothetical protein n=1 Tax=Rothia sp. (in: high G+C Gram-positive bacteria) TaxID=1885016 RepID=UPI0026E0A32A|nr:hypothetical protein [Rothia sp. (in: high G+C Gram-positive bacteria)]MDO5750424.1 hypothetical protein [Rothia sp. (in: high G+C Gram-positive bacteria)]